MSAFSEKTSREVMPTKTSTIQPVVTEALIVILCTQEYCDRNYEVDLLTFAMRLREKLNEGFSASLPLDKTLLNTSASVAHDLSKLSRIVRLSVPLCERRRRNYRK